MQEKHSIICHYLKKCIKRKKDLMKHLRSSYLDASYTVYNVVSIIMFIREYTLALLVSLILSV